MDNWSIAYKRAISVVIAELIIVAIAIVVSIGVIGYVNGWFTFGTSTAEGIQPFPDSKVVLNYTSNEVYAELHLKSNYKPSITIEKVILDTSYADSYSIISVEEGDIRLTDDGKIIMKVGSKGWIKAVFPVSPDQVKPDRPGTVDVLIVTDVGYMYKVSAKIVVISS